jgi:cytidylate kinase
MKEQTREEPQIVAAAERQMQAWVMSQEVEARSIEAQDLARLAGELQTYIAISREAGAAGSEIGEALGRRLGWEVLDKNLVDRVAEHFRLSREMLELVDETPSNWVYDVLGTWMDRKIITHEKFVTRLGRIVLAAVRNQKCVLVGRGARFLLPREKGLAVRLIAPMKYRVDRIRQLEQVGEADARRMIEEIDRGRREFVSRYFHHDLDDPHLYDLVINVERIGIAGAVEHIVAALGCVTGASQTASG